MKTPYISVILPTKNNIRTITKCLDSIVNQDFEDFEVIFVDNFSTDWTFEIAKTYQNIINIQLFQVGPERNIQRHFWFEKSSWKILYFIDSDMYLSSGLFGEVYQKFQNKELWWLIIPEENIKWEKYWTKVKAFERSFYNWDDTIEAARIFRRDVYSSVGWYNKELIAWEDWDLSERIKRSWANIDRLNSKIIHDEWEIILWQLLKKKYYYWSKIWPYVSSNSKISIISKIYFFRPVFYKKYYKFLENPILIPWFLILMTTELIMGWLGFLKNKITK